LLQESFKQHFELHQQMILLVAKQLLKSMVKLAELAELVTFMQLS